MKLERENCNEGSCKAKMFSCHGIEKLVSGDLVTMNLLPGISLYYKSILGVCQKSCCFPSAHGSPCLTVFWKLLSFKVCFHLYLWSPFTHNQLPICKRSFYKTCQGSATEARILTLALPISDLSFLLSFLTCIAREMKHLLEDNRAVVLNPGCITIAYRTVNKL